MDFDAATEFDRQVDALLEFGYPPLAGLSPADFTRLLTPLRPAAVAAGGRAPKPDRVPFVVVVPAKLVPTAAAMPLTALRGKPGAVSRVLPDVDASCRPTSRRCRPATRTCWWTWSGAPSSAISRRTPPCR